MNSKANTFSLKVYISCKIFCKHLYYLLLSRKSVATVSNFISLHSISFLTHLPASLHPLGNREPVQNLSSVPHTGGHVWLQGLPSLSDPLGIHVFCRLHPFKSKPLRHSISVYGQHWIGHTEEHGQYSPFTFFAFE